MDRAASRHGNDIVNDYLAQGYKRACIGQPMRRPSVRRLISESWKEVTEKVVIEHIPNSSTQTFLSFWIFGLSWFNSDSVDPKINHWQFGAYIPLSPVTEWLSWVFPTQERMKERKSSRAGQLQFETRQITPNLFKPSRHSQKIEFFSKTISGKTWVEPGLI